LKGLRGVESTERLGAAIAGLLNKLMHGLQDFGSCASVLSDDLISITCSLNNESYREQQLTYGLSRQSPGRYRPGRPIIHPFKIARALIFEGVALPRSITSLAALPIARARAFVESLRLVPHPFDEMPNLFVEE